MQQQSFPEFILEWWHVLMFAGATIIGYVVGNAKRGWTMEQLQAKVTAVETRLLNLEQSSVKDSRTIALVANDVTHIRDAISEIKMKMENL
jgi:hypothetical protein